MGRQETNDQEFKAQSYLRLLRYARPYWFKLTVGIVAGLLVGGSLLVSLLMVPQLVGVIDPGKEAAKSAAVTRDRYAEARKIAATAEKKGIPEEEKLREIDAILHPVDKDPKLTALLNQAAEAAQKYGLPYRVKGREIEVFWPRHFSFEAAGPDGRVAWQIFAVYVLVFVLAWVVKNIAIYVNHYYTRWVGAQVVARMRNEIFNKLLNQSLRFFGNMDVGHLISRCTHDTSAIEGAISTSVADLTCAPIQIFACLAAICMACRTYHNYSLVIVLVLGMPLVILPVHILGRKIRKYYKKSYARIAEVFSRMHEVFTGIRVVKSYNTEKFEMIRFETENRRYVKQIIRSMRLQLLLSPTMEVVAVLSTLVFLIYSYGRGITVTQLAALLAPAIMAYQPIKALSKVISSIQKSLAAADRYFQLIDTDESLPEKADTIEFQEFRDRISLHDVEFSYEDHKILDGITFDINRGEIVAVVGETGSGKTTIANLIARFYDVTGGSVTIDGVDVRDYSIASLRRMIGMVNQEAILFNDTIANNIAYGCPDATMEEIEKAARLANAHEFIVDGRHAEGYQTEVGEKGFKLSGGEKQRVAIARAILRNPPILILDEATSALDTVTEKLVQEALNRVMANRTVFAIAHRLSTIRNADKIIVLKEGHIAEAGTHEELIAKRGLYWRLCMIQFAADEEGNAR